MNEILYFYCEKNTGSGIRVNGIKMVSKAEFIKKVLSNKYYDRPMILKPEIGNALINWGKYITEEDLKVIFKGYPTYQREIIMGYSDDFNPWILRKELHFKYGKNFGTDIKVRKNKEMLLEAIELVEKNIREFG